ncbi:hypothetical protein PIB30_081656 [Stylosanthes scabra]|uniref:Uncharacterized protein n=1 Tax=Stylosanthes scabra TaxID=79078 RepID=A0ABU6QRX6_9FABA|nr:hypothetical protein [Stylosanthes scabra]
MRIRDIAQTIKVKSLNCAEKVLKEGISFSLKRKWIRRLASITYKEPFNLIILPPNKSLKMKKLSIAGISESRTGIPAIVSGEFFPIPTGKIPRVWIPIWDGTREDPRLVGTFDTPNVNG